MEAIGRLTLEFFSKYTSLVFWFTTIATLDLRLSSSRWPRNPQAVAKEGLASTGGAAFRVTVTLTPLGFLVVFEAVLVELAVGTTGAGLLAFVFAVATVFVFTFDFFSLLAVEVD